MSIPTPECPGAGVGPSSARAAPLGAALPPRPRAPAGPASAWCVTRDRRGLCAALGDRLTGLPADLEHGQAKREWMQRGKADKNPQGDPKEPGERGKDYF
jgi:hypothetical protein